jgi:hypothetical protein
MLNGKKASDLDDRALLKAYDYCGQTIAKRNEASKHPKFTNGSMPFPPPNLAFIKMMNDIENELKKRKLL